MLDTSSVKKSISQALSRPSLGDLVYERLLRAILSGELPSGATINVRALAKELGVSRIPIRDALLRLVAEGLVNNTDSRIAKVARFSKKEAGEVFDVREVLESAASRWAAERIDDEQLAELEEILEQLREVVGDPDQTAQSFELDDRFHVGIATAAGNEAMKTEIVRFNQKIWVMQYVRLKPLRETASFAEHVRILEALRARDPEEAEAAMRTHIRTGRDRLLKRWNPQPDEED